MIAIPDAWRVMYARPIDSVMWCAECLACGALHYFGLGDGPREMPCGAVVTVSCGSAPQQAAREVQTIRDHVQRIKRHPKGSTPANSTIQTLIWALRRSANVRPIDRAQLEAILRQLGLSRGHRENPEEPKQDVDKAG